MSIALDRFFDHYYKRRPVNATFTGVHAYDAVLPDWSVAGLAETDGEMRELRVAVSDAHPPPSSITEYRLDADALDAELARGFIDIQLAENGRRLGPRGNPSLWTGEAIFSVVGLMIRDFAPLAERFVAATERLSRVAAFFDEARKTLATDLPAAWTAKARRECDGAAILLGTGVDHWIASASSTVAGADRLRAAASGAAMAFREFSQWLAARPVAPDSVMSCGASHYETLLVRGHWVFESPSDLVAAARTELSEARRRLGELAGEVAGSWPAAQEQMAADHASPQEYLSSFQRIWDASRDCATAHDVVEWPDWPIRYVPYPRWTAGAAPFLYYLFYRSPAPFDEFGVYDYVVPELPAGGEEQHLRAWNAGVIKLNHVVHHGGIGHHVQNWHATHRSRSRIGKIAGVDCANRIGMFSAGTMTEGWACYATGLMDELEFLTPLERVSEAHSRVRFLTRAIVDLELHCGAMSFDDAVLFWSERVGVSADVARGEIVKASMYPGTAIMYWLGTKEILSLRETMRRRTGDEFSLKAFHGDLLEYGSIPVPLVARMLLDRSERRSVARQAVPAEVV